MFNFFKTAIKLTVNFLLSKRKEKFLFALRDFQEKLKLSLTLFLESNGKIIEEDTSVIVVFFKAIREMLRIIFTQVVTAYIEFGKSVLRDKIKKYLEDTSSFLLVSSFGSFLTGNYTLALKLFATSFILILIWKINNDSK